ncbi:hypothetical protein F5Y06DRAFT_303209 [Hypoxylon sp. FL0890]|nr:hypothetical protein F5Y06DRAFT_303209 [Hypoxylon sp. FL0890]
MRSHARHIPTSSRNIARAEVRDRRRSRKLDRLPIELVEKVVGFLDYPDAASLRLASQEVCKRASRGPFTFFYRHKTIKLTRSNLEEFVSHTSALGPACYVRHLTIAGVLPRSRSTRRGRTEPDHTRGLQRLLVQALSNLKEHSRFKDLISVRLKLVPEDITEIQQDFFRSWRAVWQEAQRTFKVTVAALHEAQLPVKDSFYVFEGVDGCSLSVDTFSSFPREIAMGSVFESLKTLKLRLSVPPKMPTAFLSDPYYDKSPFPGVGYMTQAWHSDNALRSILRSLSHLPNLEDLEVHWYDMGGFTATDFPKIEELQTSHHELNSSMESRVFPEIQRLLYLQKCTLRGIFVSDSSLIEFLKCVNPIELHLTDIRLLSGTYENIFTFITDNDSSIWSYYLDDLYEEDYGSKWPPLVHFSTQGKPKYPYRGLRGVGPSTIERQSDLAKLPITWRCIAPNFLTNDYEEWRDNKMENFGPLDPGKYDFVKLNKGPDNGGDLIWDDGDI